MDENEKVLAAVKETISKNMEEIVSPLAKEQKEFREMLNAQKEAQEAKNAEVEKQIKAVSEVNLNIQQKATLGGSLAWKDAAGEALHKLLNGEIKTLVADERKGLLNSKGVVLSNLAGSVVEQWIPEVFRIGDDVGAFLRSNPRIVPIAETTNMAVAATEPSVTWKSQGSGEGAEKGDTSGTTTKATASRDRLIATIKMSNESLSYSNIQLVNYFTELLREKVSAELDKQAYTANGTPFTGVFKDSGVTQYQLGAGKIKFSDIDWTDIRKIRRKVKSSVLGTCVWILSNTVCGLIETIEDENHRPIYDQVTDKIALHPVLITDEMPADTDSAANTDFMIFGSGRMGHVLGTGGFQVAVSEHVDFLNDNIALRVTMDAAMDIILGGAYVKVTTAEE